MDITAIYSAVRRQVVGREDEAQLILAALGAGRDLLLEGPPGTSKSTILRAITAANGTALHFVEGNADLTPSKLVGHHSPSRVLRDDYGPDNFVPGPLPLAMRDGGLLYVEEFNRIPEDTLNTLITAMAERELTVPRVGTIRAAQGFRVVAAMNPFDNVGTGRISGAIADRLCRVRMAYQPEAEERAIVARRTASGDEWLVRLAVRVVRRTREHPELRAGASVRAAIDFVLVAEQLARLRGVALARAAQDEAARRALIAAGQTALAIKVAVRESARRHADEIVAEVIEAVLAEKPDEPPPAPPESGPEQAPSDAGAGARGAPGQGGGAPSGLLASTGRVHSGEEAARLSANRPKGSRMFRGFAAEHPELAERLRGRMADPAAIQLALDERPEAALDLLGTLADLYDRSDLRALARRLAAELIIRTARRDVDRRGPRGRLTSAPFRGDATELDLDRTIEALSQNPWPRDDDLFVLERRRRRRAYVLMLDISGSMKGAAIFHAALALAAVAVRVQRDPFAVVAFWREAAVLKRIDEPAPLDALLDGLLSLAGRGLTDVGLGLRAGLEELGRAREQERVGLLFGDGMQTAGDPAEPFAAAFTTLHVIATGQAEESHMRCRHLAELGHGCCAVVERVGGIPAAVNRCLAV
jgi:MoxR-like ATPase/Mg-chelatase subunit ChlD